MFWMLRAGLVQENLNKNGGKASLTFAGADMVKPHFFMSDPFKMIGFTLYYNGGGQLAVLEVKKAIERGLKITIVAKNISDMLARDFVLAGAVTKLIDFNTKPIRMFNLISDGIFVQAILDGHAGYGQVLDLRKEEKEARDKKGTAAGLATIYVLGHFGPPCVKRICNGVSLREGRGKRDDIIEAGGYAVDLNNGSGSEVVAYALNR